MIFDNPEKEELVKHLKIKIAEAGELMLRAWKNRPPKRGKHILPPEEPQRVFHRRVIKANWTGKIKPVLRRIR